MRKRDYQEWSLNGLWNYFGNGGEGNPLVVMPTGTGKSPVIAWINEKIVRETPSARVLNLVHVKELIESNYKTLMRIWPSAPAGVYSAGLGRKDRGCQITFGGIKSVVNSLELFEGVDVIIIDEAHLVGDDASSSYLTVINRLREVKPHLKVIGLTATDFRLGMGKLTEGGIFTDVAFDMSSGEAFLWLIDNGYLSRLIPKKPKVQIDTDNVAIQSGEFVTSQLDAEIDGQDIIDRALAELVEHGENRNSWLIFATSIEKAEEIATKLQDVYGIKAAAVHSKLPKWSRDERVAGFKSGKYQALVNQNILTTGFDHPGLDLIGMLRPTNSPALWVQMLGRGTRPVYAPGFPLDSPEERLEAMKAGPKQNCLVLDFAGNTERLGPINYPVIPKKRGAGGGEPPVKCCPDCDTYVAISVRICPECGHEFEFQNKLEHRAATTDLIANRAPEAAAKVIGYFKVDKVMTTRHQKVGRPDSVKVEYWCGVRRFTEYVGIEHPGYMGIKAQKWWRLHAPNAQAAKWTPKTTDEMIEACAYIRKPVGIEVLLNQKYPEIVNYDFLGQQAGENTGAEDSKLSRVRSY